MTVGDSRLGFGMFMAPFHPAIQNPTLSLQRDLELIELLDRLGFDEVRVGEHHSAGTEIIASPEVFIAAAAERTRRIKLGTGVVSLPYHHPHQAKERAAAAREGLSAKNMAAVQAMTQRHAQELAAQGR